MASSTTIPTTIERPSRVIMLSVNPMKYATMKAPPRAVGMASTTLMVELQDPRKAQQTRPVKTTARVRVSSSSRTLSSICSVPSKLTVSRSPSGSVPWSSCPRCLTRRATSTELVPRCLRMPMPTEGLPITRATRRTSSRPSSRAATSSRRTVRQRYPSRTRPGIAIRPSSGTLVASPRTRTLSSSFGVVSLPAGSSACWAWMAAITSSAVSCQASSLRASSHTRTLGST